MGVLLQPHGYFWLGCYMILPVRSSGCGDYTYPVCIPLLERKLPSCDMPHTPAVWESTTTH